MSAALKINRTLHKNAPEASSKKGYDVDAEAIAKVLVRHYGDEVEIVLERVVEWLPAVRRTKR